MVHIPELAVRLAYKGYDFSHMDLGGIVERIVRSNRESGRIARTFEWVMESEDGVPYDIKEVNIPYL